MARFFPSCFFDCNFKRSLQTSSYGSCASKKGKPDLQCRREESSGVLQPGGKKEERKQDPVELQGDGLQEDQGQR